MCSKRACSQRPRNGCLMLTTTNNREPLMDERELSRLRKVWLSAIRRWRLLGQGPQSLKLNSTVRSAVRHRPGDVSSRLESGPTGGNHGLTEFYNVHVLDLSHVLRLLNQGAQRG
jgi:hypothetical protein